MNKISFSVLCVFIVMSTKAIADISIPPFKAIAWEEKTYKTTLPKPFGKVVVNLHANKNRGLEMMTVEIQGLIIKVDAAHLVGVDDPGEPEITMVTSDHYSQSESKQFKVSFEYGVPQRQLLDTEDECGDRCYEWVRKSMVITIDQNYFVIVNKY